MSTFAHTDKMVVTDCCNCHINFAMPESIYRDRVSTKKTFYCPNGHAQHFTGESDTQRAQRLAGELDQERTRAQNLREANQRMSRDLDYAQRARKNVSTRLKKTQHRVKHGVCPCCQRTFQQLARHMAAQHPTYATARRAQGDDMKSSYYWNGKDLPDTLTVTDELRPPQAKSVAMLHVELAAESLRHAGGAPSPEFRDVYDFHRKFGLPAAVVPRQISRQELAERVEFLLEELRELARGCGLRIIGKDVEDEISVIIAEEVSDEEPSGQNLGEQADALIDLVYVALGTAVMLGLPWDTLWADVHRANLSKIADRDAKKHLIKPKGWAGPSTNIILERAGYREGEP